MLGSDDIFQGIRLVFVLKSLLWVGLFLRHLIYRLHYEFQNVILNLVTEALAVDETNAANIYWDFKLARLKLLVKCPKMF